MGGGFHFLVEIELKMAKMPAFTNLKEPRDLQDVSVVLHYYTNIIIYS